MAGEVKCAVCGEPNEVPTCSSCGSELVLGLREAIGSDRRVRVALERARAAADRIKAAEDRARAAADRRAAIREREQSRRNRNMSAGALLLAATDDLTGVWTRRFGLQQTSRELERAHRTGGRLVLAFVDVDGLKAVNDRDGHLAGDALLRLVGETIRASVRPYDTIVRYGGDEFVCAMPSLGAADARARFETIAATLTAVNESFSISFGFAEAGPDDSLHELIARADADLLRARDSGTGSV